MSKTEITTTISHRSLMNKSKSDLADLVLEYADLAEKLRKAGVYELYMRICCSECKGIGERSILFYFDVCGFCLGSGCLMDGILNDELNASLI